MGTKREEEEEEEDDVEKKLDETRGVIDSAKKNDDKHATFADIFRAFVLMGWTAFGGPAAHRHFSKSLRRWQKMDFEHHFRRTVELRPVHAWTDEHSS